MLLEFIEDVVINMSVYFLGSVLVKVGFYLENFCGISFDMLCRVVLMLVCLVCICLN